MTWLESERISGGGLCYLYKSDPFNLPPNLSDEAYLRHINCISYWFKGEPK